jgi:hypothetical protein
MGAANWHALVGTVSQKAGTSGSITVPSGSIVLSIAVHSTAGGSFTLFGGPSVTVVANAQPLFISFGHTLWQSNSANSGAITFTSTDMYVVEIFKPGNT